MILSEVSGPLGCGEEIGNMGTETRETWGRFLHNFDPCKQPIPHHPNDLRFP